MLKNNYTPMSDLSDYLPKSLCTDSKNTFSDSSISLTNPQLEKMKSSEHESVQMDSRNRTSELKRIRNFLDQHKDMIPWLKDKQVGDSYQWEYERIIRLEKNQRNKLKRKVDEYRSSLATLEANILLDDVDDKELSKQIKEKMVQKFNEAKDALEKSREKI